MWPWIVSGVLLLGGCALYFYERWRRQKAEDNAHVWQTKASQFVRDMTDLVAAANDRDARRIGVTRVARAQLDRASEDAAAAAVAAGDPDSRFVRDSLREAAAAADVARVADVPGPAPAHAAPAGDRGGNR